MDAMECLKTRRSVRSFKAEPVPEEVVREIVDAGRLAATARNVQPWEFVVVTDSALRQKLAGIMEYGKFIAEAPVCIVVLCQETKYYLEDGCAATENLLLAAHALGLGACWVAGDKKPYADAVRQMVGAPEGYRLVASVALGKPAAGQRGAPAKRPLDEVIHWERF
ncbi:MAG TPA: nitroreductase family protein [Firmicutes bacterium]|nr:nitroreductase family protein [Bacillota bacterium]